MNKGAPPFPLDVLVSYAYFSNDVFSILSEVDSGYRLLVDSGAFTAWSTGKPIRLDDYCRFLEQLPVKVHQYVSLDVVGDATGTKANYYEMRRRGFEPVPVYQKGSPIEDLDEYFETSDIVAIGGLGGSTNNRAFINAISEHVADRKVHWLGAIWPSFLKSHRPHQCDASSWTTAHRYARLSLYEGGGKFSPTFTRAGVQREDRASQTFLMREGIVYLDAFDANPTSDFFWENRWEDGSAAQLSAMSYLAYAHDLRFNVGTSLYQASQSGDLRILVPAKNRLDALIHKRNAE